MNCFCDIYAFFLNKIQECIKGKKTYYETEYSMVRNYDSEDGYYSKDDKSDDDEINSLLCNDNIVHPYDEESKVTTFY